MNNPHIILLSGELRVFDMPVKPKICQFHCGTIGTCACNVLDQQHDSEVYEAIRRSIKIDNSELVPWVVLIQSRGKTISIHKKTLIDMDGMAGVGSEPLNEGDQFPLPKGLKVEIKTVMSEGWQPTYNNPDNHNLEPPAEPIQIARLIKEPVKNVLVTGEGSCEAAIKIAKRLAEEENTEGAEPVTLDSVFKDIPKGKFDQHYKGEPREVSEPSESQEECKECTIYFGYKMYKCFHCQPKIS